MPVLLYGNETLFGERRRSLEFGMCRWIRGLLGNRRLNRVSKARIRELCGVVKGSDERIDQGVLRWLSHIERMKNDRIAKRV